MKSPGSEPWKRSRLRFKASVNPKASAPLDQASEVSFIPMEAIGEDGTLRLDQTRRVADVSQGYTYFEEGDVSIAKITPCFENGKGGVMKGLVGGVGFGTTELIVMRPGSDSNAKFLYYLTASEFFRAPGEASMFGAGGQKRISDLFVKDFETAWPPVDVQADIAFFLDVEMARIDALIDEKRKLLDLLKELMESSFLQFASLGLVEDVPLRESGIAWAKKIPSHWQVKRNMFLFRERTESGIDGLPLLMVSLHSGVTEGAEDDQDSSRVRKQMTDRSAYKLTHRGDVVYNTMRAWQGAIGAVKNSGLVSPAYVVLEPTAEMNPEYFELLARTSGYKKSFEQRSYGIASFRWRLYWEGFKEILTPVPPIHEQVQIVEKCTEIARKSESLTAHVLAEIEVLKELRSTTITDAVLGRIDVRVTVQNKKELEAA
jgi:type I restriction enzyme S subunit